MRIKRESVEVRVSILMCRFGSAGAKQILPVSFELAIFLDDIRCSGFRGCSALKRVLVIWGYLWLMITHERVISIPMVGLIEMYHFQV